MIRKVAMGVWRWSTLTVLVLNLIISKRPDWFTIRDVMSRLGCWHLQISRNKASEAFLRAKIVA